MVIFCFFLFLFYQLFFLLNTIFYILYILHIMYYFQLSIFASVLHKQRKDKKMKVKLKINANDYEVEIKARDISNLNVTKSATLEVLHEIALLFSYSCKYYENLNCSTLFDISYENAKSVYRTIKENEL